jgi:type II secretory pathway component PulL
MFNLELRRKMLVSLVVSIICGSSLLVLPVHVADLWGKSVAAHIPDPLPLPCRRQNWTNADRVCLSWTAPRNNMSQIALATNRDRSDAAVISTMQ